ncbi:hypothetical protein [Ensifer sp. B1-9]|uniref:hypothetical protein n=1 Tax=Ensifer sp. B1-9 TaxID=3141455 RepID=UPI003D1D0C82
MNVHTAEEKKTTKYFEVMSIQRLTPVGKLGAWLFILSPIFDGFFYWWLINELAEASDYSRNLWGPSLCMIVSTMTFLGGLVMVIVGREQRSVFQEFDHDPGNWWRY